MSKLKIDGKEITARRGETVLEVCQREGIYIPTLCYQKNLTPYGGCRLCIVEVKGWSMPAASCTLPVEDGMVIKTNTPKLKKLRKFSLQLILSEHPHSCLICEKEEECAQYQECIQKSAITFGCKFCSQNNNCELQKLVSYFGVREIPFIFNYRHLGIERFDPFFDRDYNICILCGRCVRVCGEIRGAHVLDFHHRGPDTLVGTSFDLPHLETGCQFCGACVDVCPTGALHQRYGKWEGEVQKSVTSTCILCSIGCSIKLNVCNNKVVSSTPNNNQICVRGRFGIAPLIHHPKRITAPMIKRNGRMVQVSWEEALNCAVSKFNEHRGKIGILFSNQLTTEAIDSTYNFANNLKCNNITASLEMKNNFKPYDCKKIKGDSVFIFINTNMIENYSPLFLKLKSKRNVNLVVIDSLKNRFSEVADFWLRPKPGKEIDVLKLLFARKKMSNTTGVSYNTIKLTTRLLSGKKTYLFCNPNNIDNIHVPKRVRLIPLYSQINALKILNAGVGCSLADLLNNNKIDCLYLIGSAPKLSRDYKTIIVQDNFPPLFEFDVFLPTATFTETKGTYINIEGKKKILQKAIDPPGKSKPDDWIIAEMSKILKFGMNPSKQKYRKIVRRGALKKRSLTRKYPHFLIVRENCYSYRGLILSLVMKGFKRLKYDNYIWIAPDVAKKLNIKNGMELKIQGQNIDITMPAYISDTVPENCVFAYSHLSMGINTSQPVRLERAEEGRKKE